MFTWTMNANRIILILGCTNSTPDTSFLLIALEGYNAFQFSKLSARVYPLRKQHHILVRNQKFANHASVWHNVCHAIHGGTAALHSIRVSHQCGHPRPQSLQELLHHIRLLLAVAAAVTHVIGCEAEVERGGGLQGIPVPACLLHQVVQLVHVELGRVACLNGHHAHLGAAHNLQLRDGVHALLEPVHSCHQPACALQVALLTHAHHGSPCSCDQSTWPAPGHGGRDVEAATPVGDGGVL
mmetsp:Transcript_18528/g.52032  ORF Transcript_18528/g.52032 Transcript_18528/m.52032 type:complete len:240 (-) Transcript_18528:1253-1972(-)